MKERRKHKRIKVKFKIFHKLRLIVIVAIRFYELNPRVDVVVNDGYTLAFYLLFAFEIKNTIFPIGSPF